MSQYTFIGIIIQFLMIGMLWANRMEAQPKKLNDIYLSIEIKNQVLNQVFNTIETKTGFKFTYVEAIIQNQERFDLSYRKISLEALLTELSKQAGIKFKRVNNNIHISFLKNSSDERVEEVEITIQTRNVSGKVTAEEDNEGLPGVNVVEKGTSNGTVTNVDGEYNLTVNEGATVVFSSVGYATEEIAVGNRSVIDLKMTADIQQLQELVVVGYGTQQKRDLTVAISQVKAEELRDIPVSSIDQALAGRATGVSVVQGSGGPGARTSIRIRGSNSINSSSEPLYVIDGLPIATTTADNSGGSRFQLTGDQINILASINPNEIESIEILKDAAATSIYGARGANGVILITTRKGRANESKISFSGYYGAQQISKSMDMLDATELSQLIYDARSNSGVTLTDNPELLNRNMAIPDTYNTDWLDLVSRIAPIQDYNLNLTGGGEKSTFSLSVGYFSQEGVIKATDLNRYSARLNLESAALNDRISLGANLAVSRTESQMLNTSHIYSNALFSAPNLPVYDQEGFYTYNLPENFFNDGFKYPTILFDMRNYTRVPMYNIEMVKAPKVSDKMYGNLFLDAEIIEGLNYRLNVGLDINQNKIKFFSPEFGEMRYGMGAANDLRHIMNYTYTIENTLNYSRSFGKHRFNVLLGQSAQTYNYEMLGFTAANLDNFYTFWGNPDNGWAMDGDNFNTGGKYSAYSDWTFSSYFGRVNYNLSDKYLFTGTVRMDGSSKFGANKKWGVFPGISAAWVISNEEFLAGTKTIDNLKLRLGYGITGNSNISNFLSLFVMSNIGAPIGGNYKPAFAPRRLVDKDLSWESTGQFNVGVDLSMFNSRLNTTLDFYRKHTWDMIDALEVSMATGFSNITATNVGELKGSGIELSLGYDILDLPKLNWNSRLNLTRETTRITLLADEKDFFGNSNGDIRSYIDKPIGEFYGYKVLGLFQDGDEISTTAQPNASPGDYKYLDWNGYDENGEFTNEPDGQLNDADRVALGNALPDLMLSWNNVVKFHNFDFTAYFYGVTGLSVYNQARWQFLSLDGVWNNSKESLNRWTPENTNTMIQRAAENRINGKDGELNSEFVEDASYLRLANLTIGYNLKPFRQNSLRTVRLYVSGQNLLTFTSYSGVDPEVSGAGLVNRGIDDNSYPRTKTYLMGLNVNF